MREKYLLWGDFFFEWVNLLNNCFKFELEILGNFLCLYSIYCIVIIYFDFEILFSLWNC